MYGTIFRMKVKSGQEERVTAVFKNWEQEQQPKVKGAIGGYLFKPDNKVGELIGVAVFEDKASYMANANNPEQSQRFNKLRELLEADPEWEDGEYLAGGIS